MKDTYRDNDFDWYYGGADSRGNNFSTSFDELFDMDYRPDYDGRGNGDPDRPKPASHNSAGTGTRVMNWVQTGLDIVGLIPGIGEVADGVNSLIYLSRGDYVSAGLSAAAMIPFVGWGATGAKLGKKTYSVYQGFDKATGAAKYIGITSRTPTVRFAEHLSSSTARSTLRYDVVKGAESLSKTQARVLEQQLINQQGLQNLLNTRNSIAPKYWWQHSIKP
jgi:predicted GIY-YIG superfamily endonuclease